MSANREAGLSGYIDGLSGNLRACTSKALIVGPFLATLPEAVVYNAPKLNLVVHFEAHLVPFFRSATKLATSLYPGHKYTWVAGTPGSPVNPGPEYNWEPRHHKTGV